MIQTQGLDFSVEHHWLTHAHPRSFCRLPVNKKDIAVETKAEFIIPYSLKPSYQTVMRSDSTLSRLASFRWNPFTITRDPEQKNENMSALFDLKST